jgi:hypothetical protein
MVFPNTIIQSPWLEMALDCLGTQMKSWKRAPTSWDCLASTSEEQCAPRTLTRSNTYLLTMLSHWSGGKSGHPGKRRVFLTTRVGWTPQSSRRLRHCWTSDSSLAQRTAEIPFQGKSPSLTQALWHFLDPSSTSSNSKLTECCLLASLGLDGVRMNLMSGSGSAPCG